MKLSLEISTITQPTTRGCPQKSSSNFICCLTGGVGGVSMGWDSICVAAETSIMGSNADLTFAETVEPSAPAFSVDQFMMAAE